MKDEFQRYLGVFSIVGANLDIARFIKFWLEWDRNQIFELEKL